MIVGVIGGFTIVVDELELAVLFRLLLTYLLVLIVELVILLVELLALAVMLIVEFRLKLTNCIVLVLLSI
jgi:hypothetical protein